MARVKQSKQGSTIVMVLVLSMVMFIVAGSVLTAVTVFHRSLIKNMQNTEGYFYAKSFATYLTEKVTTGTEWKAIPQGVYNAHAENMALDITDEALTLTAQDTPWFAQPDTVPIIEIRLDQQDCNVYQAYVAPSGGHPAIPEEARVTVSMSIKITVPYKNSTYTLSAHYFFDGITSGNSVNGGLLVSGAWRFTGYTHV